MLSRIIEFTSKVQFSARTWWGIKVAGLLLLGILNYKVAVFYKRLPLDNQLVEAVERQDVLAAQVALVRGASPNARDRHTYCGCLGCSTPYTPALIRAIGKSDLEMVDLLLAHGADPNISGRDGPPITAVVTKPGLPILRALLDAGAVPDLPDSRGDTALIRASYRGDIHSVRLLLERGANPNLGGNRGYTALDQAVECRSDSSNVCSQITSLLIEHGAYSSTKAPESGVNAVRTTGGTSSRNARGMEVRRATMSPDSELIDTIHVGGLSRMQRLIKEGGRC
jgi:hypothetical protein